MAYQDETRGAERERLRKNMITNSNAGKGAKHPSPIVFIAAVLIIAAVVFGIYYFGNSGQSTGYSVLWSRSIEGSAQSVETFKAYESFNGGIIKYTKDGAEYVDDKGNVVWERSYQLSSPIIDVSGSYAVIGDQGGTKLYIFSTTEQTGSSETLLPISLLRVSDNGVVYGVLNDSAAEYIAAFKSDGTAIDLSVKSVLSGDGYPFDISVSPDGTELLTSYISIENGQLVNNVVFRNFGAIGQNEDARRIVGGFKDEFSGHLAGKVHFSSNEYSQAFYDGGLVFFSTEVLNSPTVLANVSIEDKIDSVAYSDGIESLMISPDDSSASHRLMIYDSKGSQLADVEIEDQYSSMTVSGDLTVLRSKNNFMIYSKNGRLRGSFEFTEGDVTGVVSGSGSILYVLTGTDMYKIRF